MQTRILALATVLLTPPLAWSDDVFKFTAEDVALPPGAASAGVKAINTKGEIAGTFILSGQPHAFFWSNGILTDLTDVGAPGGVALSLNDEGRVTGYYQDGVSEQRVFVWNGGAAITALPPDNIGATFSLLQAFRAAAVGGFYSDGADVRHAFGWTPDGGFTDLTPANSTGSEAKCVDENGIFAGHFKDANGVHHACTWTPGFEPFPIPIADSSGSTATVVQTSGGAVGGNYINSSDGHSHGYVWITGGASAIDLHPAGAVSSTVKGIEFNGYTYGSYDVVGSKSFAFVWNGKHTLLAPDEATGSTITGSNDFGVLIGGFSRNGFARAFQWTVVGGMEDLTPSDIDAQSSAALAVNAKGSIVGSFVDSAGKTRAAIFEGGQYADLSPDDVATSVAQVINDLGQVAGTYTTTSGETRLFVLTPAPDIKPTPTPAPVPTAAPEITFPGKRKFRTDRPRVTLRGSTRGEVTRVIYRVGKKGPVPAKGTHGWTANVRLKAGKNTVLVSAQGPGGTSRPLRIIVERVPSGAGR